MKSSSNKFPGGSELHKELQGFAGFVAYQNTCLRNGTAMARPTQEKRVGELYFGNPDDPDSVGLSHQLVGGTGLFAHMYDTEEISQQTNSHQLTSTNRSNVILVLKPFLHCIPDARVIVGTQMSNINLPLILSSGLVPHKSATIKTRSLWTRIHEHIKNGKKALSIVVHQRSPYKAYASTGNLPSGMSMDDYCVYVRKRMFVLLTSNTTVTMKKGESLVVEITADPLLISQIGTTVDIPALFQGVNDTSEASIAVDGYAGSMIGVERFLTNAGGKTTATECTSASYLNEEDTENVDTKEEIGDDGSGDLMPDNWTYPGYIAFILLGPIVPPAMVPYRTALFMTGLPPVASGDTSSGRAKTRRMDKSKTRADATRIKTLGQITNAASECCQERNWNSRP